MMPEWIIKILESMGVAGAIIFVLMTTVVALVAYIRSMQAKADKIYGYRLQERDTLNKALTDSAAVLKDMLRVTEERNELTEDQAKLLERQSQAFELLKVTVLAQYESIRDHNGNSAQVIGAMAEAIRSLTSIAMENRTIALGQVQSVQKTIDEMSLGIREAIRASSQSQIVELRNLLGDSTTVVRRRRKP
jgi:hypothetical protein